MTVRVSTGLDTKLLQGGTTGGVKGALALGFIYLYPGSQPASADTGATGTLLGKVSVNHDGTTGLTFDDAAVRVIAKAAAESWQFIGLADGQIGWARFSAAADTPTATSTTAVRLDMSVGTAGADMNAANVTVVTGAISTVDNFSITMPGS